MIPRILHRVVPKDTADEVERFWQGWCDLHEYPSWERMTWRDPIDPALFPLTGDLFDRVSGAQLAGLIRLEVLYTYGGIYLDSDVEPLRALDDLLCHPVFVCREDAQWCNDAVIGSVPGHPFIKACIDNARDWIKGGGDAGETGPRSLTYVLRRSERGKILTDIADVTVLSARAFNPCHYTRKHELPPPGPETAHDFLPESYGVHRWHASWLP